MEGSSEVRSWLRCYRCWSQNLEVQVHYEGIHRIDADTGERCEVVDEMQEAVVQCVDCMHDQPHLGFHNGRVEPVEDSWERMIAGAPWVASCTVTVDADDIETCSGPEAEDALSHASFGEHGTREFFTHVRFHKHDEDRIVVQALRALWRGGDRGARGGSARHARDHVARGGVTPAGGDRRRPALTALRTLVGSRSGSNASHSSAPPSASRLVVRCEASASRLERPDLTFAAFPSQLLSSRCCEDRLNPRTKPEIATSSALPRRR